MKEPIIGWARPLRYSGEPYHGVIAIDPHRSVETACKGRWSTSEPGHYMAGRDRDRTDEGHTFKKCGACDDIAKEQRTNDGLRELAAVAEAFAPERVQPFVDAIGDVAGQLETFSRDLNVFDVSDLGGES